MKTNIPLIAALVLFCILTIGYVGMRQSETIPAEPINTSAWITGGEIPSMPESDRLNKLADLRLDRDYYRQMNDISYTTGSMAAIAGDVKTAIHYKNKMLWYQKKYKEVADSIEMYHHNQILNK